MVVKCPKCKTTNDGDAVKCVKCGALLSAANDITLPEMKPLSDSATDATFIQSIDAASLVGGKVILSAGYFTNVGRARKVNQDSMLVMEMDKVNVSNPTALGLYVVADGMGGHKGGEVASGVVVSTLAKNAAHNLIAKHFDNTLDDERIAAWISSAVRLANNAVLQRRVSDGTDMGSTMVLAVVRDGMARIAHVGDSRAYRLSADGHLDRLTMDHSLVEQLVAANQITPEQARVHHQRNVIFRTMGEKEDVDVEQQVISLEPGDRLILCCDGLNGMIEDEQIRVITRESSSPAQAARNLVAAANSAGGDDNITVIVVEISTLD